MTTNDPETQSPLSVGMEWASRITTLGLSFSLPMVAGAWLDRRYGTGPWGVLAGLGLGLAAGVVGLRRLVQAPSGGSRGSGRV